MGLGIQEGFFPFPVNPSPFPCVCVSGHFQPLSWLVFVPGSSSNYCHPDVWISLYNMNENESVLYLM